MRARTWIFMPDNTSGLLESPFPPLEKGKLRLYSMRFCPFAQRTRLMLAHKNIPYETVNINLKSKPDWFLERNPLGMVPVLEKDGQVVHESAICNDYLDEVYPQNRLNPTDPYSRARDRILLERFGKVISMHYKMAYSLGKDLEAKESYLTNLDIFEVELGKRGAYFGGASVSNLDMLLWPSFERWVVYEEICKFKPSAERYPKLTAWVARMYKEPAVKATMFSAEAHLAFGKSALGGGMPDYDYGL